MNALLQAVLLAVRALRQSGLRSALTITGLLIGVAAVVVVTGLSNGAKAFIQGRYDSLGTNIVAIFPPASPAHGKSVQLDEDDAQAIVREVPSITSTTPVIWGPLEVGENDKHVQGTLVGTTLAFFHMKNWRAAKGSLWTPTEEVTKAKVCVLGATIARGLFAPGEDPIGRTIRIGQYPHRIIGVLEAKGLNHVGEDQDDGVLMPIGSARMRVMRLPGRTVSVVFASASSAAGSQKAAKVIRKLLRQRRKSVGTTECTVLTQKGLQQMLETALGALTAFLICVATMSLLVGGIGVMNIMLVSVTERTQEIGIRIAVGASRADVLTQFLIESATLAAIGGTLGIVFGRVLLVVFEAVFEWPMPVSPFAMFVSLGVSAVTGIFFGFTPALRAAQLDPIEALRRE